MRFSLIFGDGKIDFATFLADKNKDVAGQSSGDEKPEPAENLMDKIAHFFADKLHLSSVDDEDDADGRHVLQTVDVAGVVNAFKAGKFKKIVTMVGAGNKTDLVVYIYLNCIHSFKA